MKDWKNRFDKLNKTFLSRKIKLSLGMKENSITYFQENTLFFISSFHIIDTNKN